MRTDTETWVRSLKAGDRVKLLESGESPDLDLSEVSRVYPAGFQEKDQDMTGRYLVEVQSLIYGLDGRAVGFPSLSIADVTQEDLDDIAHNNLVNYMADEMSRGHWDDLDTKDLRAIYQLVTGTEWID